jgi:hypothetical protein
MLRCVAGRGDGPERQAVGQGDVLARLDAAVGVGQPGPGRGHEDGAVVCEFGPPEM